jgi:small nuclear ribonucleoprotein (snRNP)-like protein
MNNYDTPLDLLRYNIGHPISVKLRNNAELEGKLIGYDEHLNMMIDEATIRKDSNQQYRNLVYLRGDMIMLVGKK